MIIFCKQDTAWYVDLRISFLISFRVAWKNRCKDDPDIERYTKDCEIETEKTFYSKLFKPGVIQPSQQKEGVRKADVSWYVKQQVHIKGKSK